MNRCAISAIRRNCAVSLNQFRFYWHRQGYRPNNIEPGTYPFPRKQVPVDGLKSYEERIKEISFEKQSGPSVEPVNIGFKFNPPKRAAKVDRKPELEALARRRELKISPKEIEGQGDDHEAPIRRQNIAKHYGIFQDLFGSHHFFTPVVDVPIFYPLVDTSEVLPVFSGNHIAPEHTQLEPLVDFSRLPKGSLWTLVMTCPDEPLSDESSSKSTEYIHWMIGNINPEIAQDNVPKDGDLIVDYLPPLPYFGTGYHRYVFLLYRQDNGRIDFSKEMRGPVKENYHEERVFSTEDFYRRFQDELTPAGVSFFQASWDKSVRSYFRQHFPKLSEPIFEVAYPDELPPPQSRYPLTNSWFRSRRHPWGLPLANSRLGVHEDVSFNVYLDRYRDRREMDTELVRLRLDAEGNPLERPDEPREQSPFPLVSPPLPEDDECPSWWKQEEIERRLRKGRWAKLEGHED